MRKFLLILGLLVLLERGLAIVLQWFEVRPIVVVLHFIVVLFIVGAVAGAGAGIGNGAGRGARGAGSGAGVVGLFVFATLFLGAWVSAHIGAPEACHGFPLCNGGLLPSSEHLVRMNWSHRIASYATVFVVLFYAVQSWRQKAPSLVRKSAVAAVVIVALQSLIGVALVLDQLPQWVRGMHLALGVLLWAVVVVWWRSSRSSYSP